MQGARDGQGASGDEDTAPGSGGGDGARDDEPRVDEAVEVRCPECGVTVSVPRETAERAMQARCPAGHAIALFRAI